MIEVIYWIVLLFAALQLVVSVSNIVFKERLQKNDSLSDAFVSILIPARNEVQTIGILLNDIISLPHKNLEVIVADDQSDDGTSEVVERFMVKYSAIKLVKLDELPQGWMGKNYACHRLSEMATGDYLLFLDADVRLTGNIIGNMVNHAQRHRLSLISIFPKQIMKSWGEKLTVPLMNYILLSLLPLFLVRKSRLTSLSAANGQFMFFNAPDYHSLQPHAQLKDCRVEDIAIAKLIKRTRLKASCMLQNQSVSCQMYSGLNDSVNGFTKNIIAFFGNSAFAAILFLILTTMGWYFVFLPLSIQHAIAMGALMLATRLAVSLASKQNLVATVLLMLPQQLIMAVIIVLSIVKSYKKQHQWKGRAV